MESRFGMPSNAPWPRLIRALGGPKAFAHALGLSEVPAWQQWRKRGMSARWAPIVAEAVRRAGLSGVLQVEPRQTALLGEVWFLVEHQEVPNGGF